jgi:hypothetical protein
VQRKKQKIIIQVAGNPQYARPPSPGTLILNPQSGRTSFGTFPDIDAQGVQFVSGDIELRYGIQRDNGVGYGLIHIWQRHFREHGELRDAESAITAHVLSILTPGAGIFHEFGSDKDRKCSVFSAPPGTVIVQEKTDGAGKTFYSITTAYRAERVHGARIGYL